LYWKIHQAFSILECGKKKTTNDLLNPNKSYTQLFVEKAQEIDLSMDFLEIGEK
jgi:hypothetical protein